VEAKELGWPNTSINTPEELNEVRQHELGRAEERIHSAVRRLRERGIIDANGRRIHRDVPADMLEDAGTDFGG